VSGLLTADEFLSLPACEHPQELVRGRVVDYPITFPLHGLVCGHVAGELGNHVEAADAGRVILTHAVVTERDPDTVRGPDVSFYSCARLPRGPMPETGHLDVVPDLVAEVLSPSDRWSRVFAKITEYLTAG
jgi:Uma2 family endonuclease